jgi:hypothetical protein
VDGVAVRAQGLRECLGFLLRQERVYTG